MKCMNCGIDFEKSYDACPNCGAAMNQAVTVNPVAERMLAVFQSKLFFVLCILLSVSCGCQIVEGGLPLLNGLITAFLWVVFAQARKNVASSQYLRSVSGVVFANYVIMYVLAGLLVLLGALMALIFSLVTGDPELMKEFLSSVGTIDGFSADMIEALLSASGVLMLALFVLLAIIVAVINALCMRPIHRLAKSVYQSIDQGVWMIQKTGAVKGWLWVMGIFSGLGFLGSLADGSVLTTLAQGTLAAAQIIAALLVDKFSNPVQPAPTVVTEQPEAPVLPAENSET